jgi:hypothetical protein
LRSFIGYQVRDASWYPSLFRQDPYKYMAQSYASISQVASERPGLVIDYSNLFRDVSTELEKIYTYLWPQQGFDELSFTKEICSIAAKQTAREIRENLGTTFLGQNKIPEHEDTGNLTRHNRQYMDLCRGYYRDLVAQQTLHG